MQIDKEAPEENTYLNHKFCYICGSDVDVKITFHHFNNKPRKNAPKGVLKKEGEEGIPLCRFHHDLVEQVKGKIKKSFIGGMNAVARKTIIEDCQSEIQFILELVPILFEDLEGIKSNPNYKIKSDEMLTKRMEYLEDQRLHFKAKVPTRRKIRGVLNGS